MIIPKIIHESWHEILQPLFDDIKMEMILQTIAKESFYPKKEDVFKVFKMPLDKIRVVILGQDPYPNGEATGLAFGCRADKNTPPSLIVIKNEVMKTLYSNDPNIFQKNGYPSLIEWKSLEHWWKQGVFLLNTALTVKTKDSGSHVDIWRWFTRVVINEMSKKGNIVWMLWGAKAKEYQSYINTNVVMNEDNVSVISPNNGVLLTNHPAAESYDSKTIYKFSGCNHFNLCNKILETKGEKLIIW